MAYYTIPKYIFVGKNALEEAASTIATCGKKALIVTGKRVGKSPMYEKLVEYLVREEVEYSVFDGITGEPTDTMIEEGLGIYEKDRCQFVIGIGGGSPLDAAKAIAAMSVFQGELADYMGREMKGNLPPIVAIPTTAGTGSEATKFSIITDSKQGIKMLLKGDCLIPTIAVVDYDFSMDMPKSVTISTGLDALTHAVEAYTSKKAFDLTDTLAVSAVKRIMKYLPLVYHNGYDALAREQMALAALEAGICINNSSVTIVHGMSRPIGALFHVPHGMSNAILLKDCMEFALDGALERFATLGRAIGATSEQDTEQEAAEKFLVQVKKLCEKCHVPSLQNYKIYKNEYYKVIEKMAEDAIASGSPANTRKTVTKEDCIRIYKKVYGLLD